MRRVLYVHFAPLGARDIELARVAEVLSILPRTERPDYGAIGRALGCDALMTGVVTEYGSRF